MLFYLVVGIQEGFPTHFPSYNSDGPSFFFLIIIIFLHFFKF